MIAASQELSSRMANLAGWIPAVVFPVATAIQLLTLLSRKSAEGVSKAAWFSFGLANIAVYFYTEKYASLQSIVGFLGTAVLDFVIVAMVVYFERKRA